MQHDAPLTKLLCDLIRKQQGQLSKADLRTRWKAGDYRGVPADWAAQYERMIR